MARLRMMGLGMAAAAACAVGAGAATAAASETPNYQGDAGHAGGVVDPALDGPLRVLWTQRLTKGLAYPLVADGRVFVLSPAPGGGPVLEAMALDAATGAILWRRSLRAATDLTYGEGLVYVLNQGGLVVALDPATGATRWANGPTSLGISAVGAPPVIFDGTIYYNGQTGSEGAAVIALDARDGTLRWHTPLSTEDAEAGVAADEQGVYLGNVCGFGLSWTHDGALRWSTRTACEDWPSGFGERTVVVDGRVLSDFHSGAVLDATTGAIVDEFVRPLDGGLPAFGTAHVAVLADGHLTIADRGTLTTTGTYVADNPDVSLLLGQPFFVGDRVFMEDNRHHLIGVDAATATVSADVDLNVQLPYADNDQPVEGSGGIAVGGGVIAVATTDGRVVAVTGPSGPTPPPGAVPTDPPSVPAPVPVPTPTPVAHAVGAPPKPALPAAARRVTFPAGTKLAWLRRHGLTLAVAGGRRGATVDATLRAGGKVVWHARARVPESGRVRLAARPRRAIRARTARLEVRVSATHARTLVVRRTLR